MNCRIFWFLLQTQIKPGSGACYHVNQMSKPWYSINWIKPVNRTQRIPGSSELTQGDPNSCHQHRLIYMWDYHIQNSLFQTSLNFLTLANVTLTFDILLHAASCSPLSRTIPPQKFKIDRSVARTCNSSCSTT